MTEASTFTSGDRGRREGCSARGKPVWIRTRRRAELPARAGRGGRRGQRGVRVPDPGRGRVVGVVEFFSPAVAEPDDRLLELAGQVGVQLGRVIERDRHRARCAALRGALAVRDRARARERRAQGVRLRRLARPHRAAADDRRVRPAARRALRGRLDESADEFIGFIVDGTERMQAPDRGPPLLLAGRHARSW